MAETKIQEYEDSPTAREELLDFLNSTGTPPAGTASWHDRLRHWWDGNPHASQYPLRGFIVKHESRIVGFGGLIPFSYAFQGARIPALNATTLRADPSFQRAGVQMLLRLRGLCRRVIVAHTTPIPKLADLLVKMGARAEIDVTRHVFATGLEARLIGSAKQWPTLTPGLRLTANLNEVKSITPITRIQDGLEKWVCLDSLRWQLETPMYEFHFLGAIDESGALHDFLVIQDRPRTLRFLHAWDVVEAWSAHADRANVRALMGCLVKSPSLLGQRRNWLTAAAFPGESTWAEAPSLISRHQKVCHYFMLPEALKEVKKHSVMAEGDFVL